MPLLLDIKCLPELSNPPLTLVLRLVESHLCLTLGELGGLVGDFPRCRNQTPVILLFEAANDEG